jgi:Uma2 family endonuclease
VFVSNERAKLILADGKLRAAPEIVIEILSPGDVNVRRDRVLKRNLYSLCGVHEYWILDPEIRGIDVHRQHNERGLEFLATLYGDALTSPVLPGFRLAVTSSFAE